MGITIKERVLHHGLLLTDPLKEKYKQWNTNQDDRIDPGEVAPMSPIELSHFLLDGLDSNSNPEGNNHQNFFLALPPKLITTLFKSDSRIPLSDYWAGLGEDLSVMTNVIQDLLVSTPDGKENADILIFLSGLPLDQWKGLFELLATASPEYVKSRTHLADGFGKENIREFSDHITMSEITASELTITFADEGSSIALHYLLAQVRTIDRGIFLSAIVFAASNLEQSPSHKNPEMIVQIAKMRDMLNVQFRHDTKGVMESLTQIKTETPKYSKFVFEKLSAMLTSGHQEILAKELLIQTKTQKKDSYKIQGITAISLETFAAEVEKSPTPVLVIVGASWCSTCHDIEPIAKNIHKTFNREIKIVTMDADQNEDRCKTLQIESIPAFLFFNNGVEISSMRIKEGQGPNLLSNIVESLKKLVPKSTDI